MKNLFRVVVGFVMLCILTLPVSAQTQTSVKRGPFEKPIGMMTFAVREIRTDDGLNHWFHRRDNVCKLIEDNRPDIVLIQDALKDQADYMKKKLSDYGVVESAGSINQTAGYMLPVFYNSKRFSVVNSELFWFSPTPERPSSGFGNPGPMCGHSVTFKELATGNGFTVINVKLALYPQGARISATEQLARRIVDGGTPLPYLVGGDFCAPPTENSVSFLRRKRTPATPNRYYLGLQDPFLKLSGGTYHSFKIDVPYARNDNLLFSAGWKTANPKIFDPKVGRTFLSDHNPMMISAEWIAPKLKPVAKKAVEAKPIPAPAAAEKIIPSAPITGSVQPDTSKAAEEKRADEAEKSPVLDFLEETTDENW